MALMLKSATAKAAVRVRKRKLVVFIPVKKTVLE